MRVKTCMEDGLLDMIHQGQGFIRRTTPSSSQQQIHYNNGLRSHQRVRSLTCGHWAIRTRLLFTMCEARQKSGTFDWEQRRAAETSLPFAPASGAIQDWGTGEMTLGSLGHGAKQRAWDPEGEEGELINASPCLPCTPPFCTSAANRTIPLRKNSNII